MATIYAPTATVYHQDQGGACRLAAIIVRTTLRHHQLSTYGQPSHAHPGTSPLSHLQLVE